MQRAEFWNSRRVLVTGASGLLGGWMVKVLLELGAEVVVLLRDGAPRSMLVSGGYLDQVDVVHGSLSEFEVLRRTLAEYSVETIFHLGAQTQVGVAKSEPLSTLETNIRGSWNLLEAARLQGGVQVLAASSDKAYGESDHLPYHEGDPLQGRYPYDVSKSCMDLICSMYAVTYKLPVAVARCANLFGGGDLNYARAIPGAIRATLAGERFVVRSDGKFIRDYLYVEDAVRAYLRLGECLAEDAAMAGQAFNFGLGERYTVLDLVDRVLQLLDRKDLEPIVLNQASAEIREQFMSSEKARDVLGWSPLHDLDAGLLRTIQWYRTILDAPRLKTPVLAATAG